MPFNIALPGLNAANQDLNVTANNLANESSTGFKNSRAEFGDLFASTQRGVSRTAVGNGVSVRKKAQQFTQGNIETTGNNLDIAISGNGFFTLSTGGALSYTRDGEFEMGQNGNVINSQGANLQMNPALASGGFNTGGLRGRARAAGGSAPEAAS